MAPASASQRYRSTRGYSDSLGFEDVVLKGLAPDGGLFVPEEIPTFPSDWASQWKDLSFAELALEILSLYISPSEIPRADLKDLLVRSYSTFRVSEVTPVKTLDEKQNLYILELFHGPTFAFKDVALQFLGNLFEYFLKRKNAEKGTDGRHHLTVIGATSGDTGSAAIYGLRGKQDVSVFITFPHGRVSQVQEAQMTTVLDPNVHNVAVSGTDNDPATFDDCQDLVKAMFADKEMNDTHHLAAVNSINWARILAQITYYVYSYLAISKQPSWKQNSQVRFVVPSGNFGDILAGFFAKRMGLPVAKFVVATNENDILDRFFKSGKYEKSANSDTADGIGGLASDGAKAQPVGAVETLSPAMDIVVSSNFERLLYILQLELDSSASSNAHSKASQQIASWLTDLKEKGGFAVSAELHAAAAREFESEKVTNLETLATIRTFFKPPVPLMSSYILDPHSAIGVAASLRSLRREGPPQTYTISLATAHPAKFANAVTLALEDETNFDFAKQVLPSEFVGLEDKERRVTIVEKKTGIDAMRQLIREKIAAEKKSG